jgi:3-oxoacyl-[acyl-carrier protein] reductase
MFSLEGKIAAITGAGSGIGAAICCSRGKVRVFVLERDDASGAQTAQRIIDAGGNATHISCDVTDASSVASAFALIEERCGSAGHPRQQRRHRSHRDCRINDRS